MQADPRQFDMLALLSSPPAAASPRLPAHIRGECREVQTRAANRGGLITIYHEDTPEPFEVVVRGIPCVIAYSGGFCTHAIEPAGSPFWSETGFRSFGYMADDPAEIISFIERYIDAPTKNGAGMGGKLTRWWPGYALQWRQSLGFELECGRGMWAQWGPERHAECWANHDRKLAEAVERMRIEGIDPNDVGPPAHFKGRWPVISDRLAA